MISSEEIKKIKKIISDQIKLGENFSGTESDSFLRNHYNITEGGIEYLRNFHEILFSQEPDIELHLFSFEKLDYNICNFSNEWDFKTFEIINNWLIDYIAIRSEFLIRNVKIAFDFFIQCYVNLIKKVTEKYPYYQTLWNLLASRFITNVYTNSPYTSYIILYLFSEFLTINEDESENQGKIKNNFNNKSNRQSVFDLSILILEITFRGLSSNRNENEIIEIIPENIVELVKLAFKAIFTLQEFIVSSNFKIFFTYSNIFPGVEIILNLCELSLTKNNDGLIDTESIITIEENLMSIGTNRKTIEEEDEDEEEEDEEIEELKNNHFQLALQNSVNLFFFSKFIEIMRLNDAIFSPSFIKKLTLITLNSFNNDLILDHTDTALNFINFFSNLNGATFEKPPKSILKKIQDAYIKSIEKNIKRSILIFYLDNTEQSPFVITITHLFKSSLFSFVREMQNMILENLKKNERDDIASTQLALLLRIVTQILIYQFTNEQSEFIDDLVRFILNIQRDFFLPFLDPGTSNGEVEIINFTDNEVLSFLFFNKVFVEFDEFDITKHIIYNDYIQSIQFLLHTIYLSIKKFQTKSFLNNISLSILTNLCEIKSSGIFLDNDWMLGTENAIEFDVFSDSNFNYCSLYYEALFFNELKCKNLNIKDFLQMFHSAFFKAIKQKDIKIVLYNFLFNLSYFSGIIQGWSKFYQKFELKPDEIVSKNKEFKITIEDEVDFKEKEDRKRKKEKKDNEEEIDDENEETSNENLIENFEENNTADQSLNKLIFDFLIKKRDFEGNEKKILNNYNEENTAPEDETSYMNIFYDLFEEFVFNPRNFNEENKNPNDETNNEFSKMSIISNFLIFLIKFTSLMTKDQFDNRSSRGNLIFIQISSMVIKIINYIKALLISINEEESSLEVKFGFHFREFNEKRKSCVSVISLCINLSARLLSNECIIYEAFLMYNDSCYKDFLHTLIDIINFIHYATLFVKNEKEPENHAVDFDDKFNFDQIFNMKFSFYSFLKALYSTHITILYGDSKAEYSDKFFEEFFISSFSYLQTYNQTEMENENKINEIVSYKLNLLSILLHQLIEIFYLNNKVCFPFFLIENECQIYIKILFEDFVINKNKNIGSVSDSQIIQIFCDYSILNSLFVNSIIPIIEASCPLFHKKEISNILKEIDKASTARNLKLVNYHFNNFYSSWFKI